MKSMTLRHILLTRFSYRMNTGDPESSLRHAADDGFSRFDPLNPSWLDFRFALFECACLPNVVAQSNQDFDWVLIIDPDLPDKYRQRLEKLIARRERTHLHEFRPSDNLARLEWLEKYIPDETEHVLTTNIDDDDILTIDFVDKLQSHVKELGTTVPSIKFLGMKTTYQWELYSSAKHPFGTWAPWHRVNWFRSTGLTVLSKTSTHRMTCFALHHSLADIWYARGSEQQIEQIARETWGLSASEPYRNPTGHLADFQQELEKTSVSGGDDWKSLPPTELYYDLSKDGLFAVHLNHFMNDQGARLFEHKPGTVPVVDTQFFPDDFRIDWIAFDAHRDLFMLSSEQYKKYFQEINSFLKKTQKLNWWMSTFISVSYRIRLTWWFLRH